MKFISLLLIACLVITLTEAAPKKDRDGKDKKGKDGKGKKEKKDGKSKEMELGCHRFLCVANKMDYMKYAEEHKNMEALNVQDSLEKGIKMADKCSMMDEGMKPDIAPEGMFNIVIRAGNCMPHPHMHKKGSMDEYSEESEDSDVMSEEMSNKDMEDEEVEMEDEDDMEDETEDEMLDETENETEEKMNEEMTKGKTPKEASGKKGSNKKEKKEKGDKAKKEKKQKKSKN